jgi:hypothetical protein
MKKKNRKPKTQNPISAATYVGTVATKMLQHVHNRVCVCARVHAARSGSTSRLRDVRLEKMMEIFPLNASGTWSPISSVQLSRRYVHASAVLVTFAV